MIELLYAVIIVFGSSLIAYFIFPTFQYMKIYLYSFQVLIWILLISLNQYKNHYLWDEPDFNSIHELPYPPINDINIIYDSNNNVNDIKVAYSNKVYSLIQTEEYPKKCTNNYFIPQSETCPITDIIVETSNSNTHTGYERIEISNGFIYYKRDSLQAKFYASVRIDWAYNYNKNIMFDNNYKTIKFSSSFDYQNIETIRRLEENKKLKPFKQFKNYKNITDFICLFLTIFSIIYYFMGSKKDDKCNCFKVVDNFLQFTLFILYLVRFILFGKVKTFFKENEDLYNDKYLQFDRAIYFVNYFPKKMSINSFPLALSIVIIFFLFLSFVVRDKKCSAFDVSSNDDECNCFDINEEKWRVFIFFFPFLIIFIFCFILDIINDAKIKKIYKIIIENWDSSPIGSIEINSEKDYELGHIFSKEKKFSFYSWKNNFFRIGKYTGYNYMNIYSGDGDKKVCGKDSFGNSLYFPQNLECPINDIFFENNDNIDYPEYTKLDLGYNNYLYYSNKKIDKNIIIDIKVGFPKVPLELNREKTNELCNSIYDKGFYKKIDGKCDNYYKFNTVPFYKEIDHWDLYDFLENTFELKNINYIGEISLYSLTYQGFNSTSKKRLDVIIKFKKKMNSIISLSIAKTVFSSLNILLLIILTGCVFGKAGDKIIVIALIFLVTLLVHFIIVIICLAFNISYIQKTMNRINNDFERNENNYSWILFTFFLDLILAIYTLVMPRFS